MARDLSLSALRVFEAAAGSNSFKRAADDLLLTPSAVSHAIRKLERDLGTPLFLRDGRRVALTGDGEILLAHVKRGFAELWRGMEAVSANAPGLLRLHAAPSFAAQWLAPRLPQFLATHPGIEVRLASGTDYRRFDVFDADIVYGEPPGDLAALSLGQELVSPLCTTALATKIRSAADLFHLPLIESDNKRVRWHDWFSANRLQCPPRHGPHFDRSFLAIAAAVDGLGVVLESSLLAERELASGRLVRPLAGVADDISYCGHWLVVPNGRRQSRPFRSFAAWLAAELRLPVAQGRAAADGLRSNVAVQHISDHVALQQDG